MNSIKDNLLCVVKFTIELLSMPFKQCGCIYVKQPNNIRNNVEIDDSYMLNL